MPGKKEENEENTFTYSAARNIQEEKLRRRKEEELYFKSLQSGDPQNAKPVSTVTEECKVVDSSNLDDINNHDLQQEQPHQEHQEHQEKQPKEQLSEETSNVLEKVQTSTTAPLVHLNRSRPMAAGRRPPSRKQKGQRRRNKGPQIVTQMKPQPRLNVDPKKVTLRKPKKKEKEDNDHTDTNDNNDNIDTDTTHKDPVFNVRNALSPLSRSSPGKISSKKTTETPNSNLCCSEAAQLKTKKRNPNHSLPQTKSLAGSPHLPPRNLFPRVQSDDLLNNILLIKNKNLSRTPPLPRRHSTDDFKGISGTVNTNHPGIDATTNTNITKNTKKTKKSRSLFSAFSGVFNTDSDTSNTDDSNNNNHDSKINNISTSANIQPENIRKRHNRVKLNFSDGALNMKTNTSEASVQGGIRGRIQSFENVYATRNTNNKYINNQDNNNNLPRSWDGYQRKSKSILGRAALFEKTLNQQ
eukprot:CAMPEP_0174264444 /NCGR_PEP_ID=MMETSP0439-20130205/22480_1 /TAXON_ID=0 /ORGANISM="Stereomyxa ramosa, Strain Chinc5" /LENGTH=467 /DNA_ID=CAMNT_0015350315 /DNA_START=108 /DNA_END=1511 /DNA_ORIENTATION=+